MTKHTASSILETINGMSVAELETAVALAKGKDKATGIMRDLLRAAIVAKRAA
jgi:hypothetical protein